MNRFFTYFCIFSFFLSQTHAFEVTENTLNTQSSAIEILTNSFSAVQIATGVSLVESEILTKSISTEAIKNLNLKESVKQDDKDLDKTIKTFDPKVEFGSVIQPVGEVDVPSSVSEESLNSQGSGNPITDNSDPYIKSFSNAQALINRVDKIAKGPTNQLLNQVGLTPNLAKQVGIVLSDAPNEKTEGGLFSENDSKSSFGTNGIDKTSSFGSISKPSGQSASEQLQKTLDDLKKKEEEKKIAEKKDQLGKDLKKFSELKTPIAKEDYIDLKKLFQDRDNVSLLNQMQELDPNFLTNTNEAYYGKEGEGDHGVRDNDRVGKMPLLNFIDQFKNQLAANPEIFSQRNNPEKIRYIPHDRSRNEDSH